MPPNSETKETLIFSDKQEIYYGGYYYDVTSFISRHPGGKVIEFYIDKSEDATIPIQQFHGGSIKKVIALMNTLHKRQANLLDSK